jgi:HK97 family phage major capsid protein
VNPYLKRLREQYESLRSAIDTIQQTAVEASRDMTSDELRMVSEQSVKAKELHTQIEAMTEVETRNAKVAQLAAEVDAAVQQASAATSRDTDTVTGQTRSGGAQTKDRDPGHYTRSSSNSFFRDLTRSRMYGDLEAAKRLVEHNRALNTTDDGPGVVPPRWLTEEFAEIARQGRSLANVVRNIPLGDDPRPLTLPKQTAGAGVAEQSVENSEVDDTDAWDSSTDTVTPKPTSGAQIVSRQMLDMSSPAIDQLIYSDLIGDYNDKVEAKVGALIMATGTALAAIEGESVPVTNPLHFAKQALRAAVAVRQARKRPANILAMSVGRHGEFLNLTDSTGRPLIPEDSAGPMNVMGVGSVQVDGRFRSLGMIATEGMTDDDIFAAVRSSDVLLFESNMLRFRYEEPDGPESVRLGIWAYTAVLMRYGTAPVKKVEVTEES